MAALPSDLVFDAPSADAIASDRELWSLYAEAMPAEEREPQRVIVASVVAGDAVVARARHGSTRTIGFAVTHLLKQPPAAFLVYLAVAEQERGAGIGGRLFEYAWGTAERVAASRGSELLGVTWEIDDPERAPNSAEREHRVKRRNFFARLGGAPLAVAYLQPPVNGPAPVPMRLMWRAKPGRATPDVRALVRAIYFEKYGAANGVRTETLDRLLEQVLAT